MPSFEEWAHVLEVVKSTSDEAAISTLTSLKVVQEENSPKNEARQALEETRIRGGKSQKTYENVGEPLAETRIVRMR